MGNDCSTQKRLLFETYHSNVQKLVDDCSGRGEFEDQSEALEELQQLWIRLHTRFSVVGAPKVTVYGQTHNF